MTSIEQLLENPVQHGVEFRTIPFDDIEVKVKKKGDDTKMRVEGYASIFDVEDSYKDVILKGAFKETIKERFEKIRFLWQHNAREGAFGIPVELNEDSKGLWAVAEVIETPKSLSEWIPQVRQGGVQGLSIGFMTLDAELDEEDPDWFWPLRWIKKVDLIEWSAVTFPANEDATIDSLKSIGLQRLKSAGRQVGSNALEGVGSVDPSMVSAGFVEDLAGRLAEAYKALTGIELPTPASAPEGRSFQRPGVGAARGRPPGVPSRRREERSEPEPQDDEEEMPEEARELLEEWAQEFMSEDDSVRELMREYGRE